MIGPTTSSRLQIDAMCKLATSFRAAGTPATGPDASATNNASDRARGRGLRVDFERVDFERGDVEHGNAERGRHA